MLILSTLEFHHNLKDSQEIIQQLAKLREELLEKCHRVNPSSLEEEAKELLFNAYMLHSDYVFSPSSKSRVFDYQKSLQEHPRFSVKSEQGAFYLDLIEAIDKVWQETQAPVAELVGAGKYSLKKVNGAANYLNFSNNAKEMPDLFAATKALVDNYLLIDFYTMLIDEAINQEEQAPLIYLNEARKHLREFAGRGKAIGFWSNPIEEKFEILKDLNVESFAILS